MDELPVMWSDEILIIGRELIDYSDTMSGMADAARRDLDASNHQQQMDALRDHASDLPESFDRLATDAADLAAFGREAAEASRRQLDTAPPAFEPTPPPTPVEPVGDAPRGGTGGGFLDRLGSFFNRLLGGRETAKDPAPQPTNSTASRNNRQQVDNEKTQSQSSVPPPADIAKHATAPVSIGGAGWKKDTVYQAAGSSGWLVADNQNAIRDRVPGIYATWDGQHTKIVGIGSDAAAGAPSSETAVAQLETRQEDGDTVTTIRERNQNGDTATTETREHPDGSVTQAHADTDGTTSTTWNNDGEVMRSSREFTDGEGRTVREETWSDGSTSRSTSRLEPDGRTLSTHETQNADASHAWYETVDHDNGEVTTMSTRTEDDGSTTVIGVANHSDGSVTTTVRQSDGTVTVRNTDPSGETHESTFPPGSH